MKHVYVLLNRYTNIYYHFISYNIVKLINLNFLPPLTSHLTIESSSL